MTEDPEPARPAHRVLSGRYELGPLLGRGGMASVYAATDTRLGREVAVKVLRPDLARDPAFQARFRREAQSAASLNHPSVVAVYDTGEDEQEGTAERLPYIVMERVHGVTVRALLDDERRDGGDPAAPRTGPGLDVQLAVTITAGVLSALQYSHRAGIVHRDIKPANVMLTPDDQVKVMDFGIARAVADASVTMTQTQAVLGTAQYLSPEQARGAAVDARSDLYSTGCLLYELLTGRPPFTGDSAVSVAYQHVGEEPRPPSSRVPSLPRELDHVVLRALAKDREDRYPDARAFRDDLLAAARHLRLGAGAAGTVAAAAATTALPAAAAPPTAATTVTPVGAVGPAGSTGPAGPPDGATGSSDPPGAGGQPVPPPPGDDPDGADPRRGRRALWVLLALLVVALGAVAAVVVPGLGQDEPRTTPSPSVTQVSVPSLSGMTSEQARDTVVQAGLEYREDVAESVDVPEGSVVSQAPRAGAAVAPGSAVTVTVSAGPGSTVVPDVTGQSEEEARATLTANDLTAGDVVDRVPHPDIPEGGVVDTDPAPGATVEEGTSVALVLSTGEVVLEDYTGRQFADVREHLTEDLGLTVTITYEESDAEQNTVIGQDPAPGPVPQGSSVELTVASPPPPTTTAPPPTTSTGTPSPTGTSTAPPSTGTTPPTTPGTPTTPPATPGGAAQG